MDARPAIEGVMDEGSGRVAPRWARAAGRAWISGACLLAIALGGGVARAQVQTQVCDSTLSINTNCWNDYSGANFGQVAAGSLPVTPNQGLVCAVSAGSDTNWGGSVWCYKPVGINGAATVVEAVPGAPNVPFSNTDQNLRVVSIAVAGQGSSGTESFRVAALRHDSNVFSGTVPYPYYPETRGLEFTTSIPPVSTTGEMLTFRSIAALQSGTSPGLLEALTTDNRMFIEQPGAQPRWSLLGSSYAAPIAYLATDGAVLKGSNALSTDLFPLPDVPAGQTILNSCAQGVGGCGTFSDPNNAFSFAPVGSVGRMTPVVTGVRTRQPGDAWLIASSFQIFHSTATQTVIRDPTFPFTAHILTSYGPWAPYDLPPFTGSFPWSIADAANFRGARGEFFAIARGAHLVQYVPASFRLETEKLTVAAKSSDTHVLLSDVRSSDAGLTNLQSNGVNDFVTYVSPSIPAGLYQITVRLKTTSNAGTVQFSESDALNGTYISYGNPLDAWSQDDAWADANLGFITLYNNGPRYFRFKVTGKDPRSPVNGYQIFPDYIQLAQ
jgi:hypothetical protein